MEIKKCKCGCNTEIVVDNGKVFSDHTSKWMAIKEWNELSPQNKVDDGKHLKGEPPKFL